MCSYCRTFSVVALKQILREKFSQIYSSEAFFGSQLFFILFEFSLTVSKVHIEQIYLDLINTQIMKL